MVLLMLFGLLAGAGTALSPCVLPVLPIALSAGATGGRRRPLGIVAGLTASFTFATVALVYVISALGLPNDLLRTLAIVVLLAFGGALLVPALGARVEAWLSRFAGRAGVAGGERDGFWSGTLVGASLGLVYAPCAGPILSGVIVVSASQSFSAGRLAVALCYAIGSGVVLYGLMLGGRRLTAPLARRSGRLQMAMGVVMVLVAVAMLNNYDLRFQSAIAKDLPAFLVDPTKSLENTQAARDALAGVRGKAHGIGGAALAKAPSNGGGSPDVASNDAPAHSAVPHVKLKDYGVAPEFTGTQRWFNTPGGRPLTLKGLRGRVVLVDFWTYSCINCLRTLPYLEAWDKRYRADGLTIVGVHTPEFPFEKDAGNVQAAIAREGIRYPVVQDNDMATWNAYGNEFWPAEYFVDARGHVQYADAGEGSYDKKEAVIRELLAQAGRKVGGGMSGAHGLQPSVGVSTPESYLGAERAERFVNGSILPGPQSFGSAPTPPQDELAYGGHWDIGSDHATAGQGAQLLLTFGAQHVYLVLGSPGATRHIRVLLDGKPLPAADAGADVHDGVVSVSSQRLYSLVSLKADEIHHLQLLPDPGVTGYAFTFG
jgi:cytochrome c biogenesis protein CcdA/thiol-disulfide isomerase/thioredoxin